MANWNLPAITSGYLDFVTELNEKFIDAATLQVGSPTNLPDFTIRFNRTPAVFEELYQGVWYTKFLGISGGGTGSSTPAGARTNLGLGSMSTQNSNAVAITGGSITGVNYNANDITSGIVALARGGTGSSLTLAGVGAVFISNGTQVVWDTGVNIAQLNANALIVGTVPDARLSVNVAMRNLNNTFLGSNEFQGYVTFSHAPGANSPTIVSASPTLNFFDAAGATNEHYYRITVSGRNFLFQELNDAYAVYNTYVTMNPF